MAEDELTSYTRRELLEDDEWEKLLSQREEYQNDTLPDPDDDDY